MNIIFFGTSEFAAKSLEALMASSHETSLVVTKPMRQKGRGLKQEPTAVENCATKAGLKIATCGNVNSKDCKDALKRAGGDVFVVVDFGQVLSDEVLRIPRLYCINLHASLLPKYRGASPIQQAIINGDKITGVTVMRVNRILDSGDIMSQEETEVGGDEDAQALSQRLSALGAQLLIRTIDDIEAGRAKFEAQDDSKATYAPKLKKEDGMVNWQKDAASIKNLIRGCYAWPSAYTYLEGKLLKILKAEELVGNKEVESAPGAVIKADNSGIVVACGRGAIIIKRLQLEAKKPLDASEFLRGRPVRPGVVLG